LNNRSAGHLADRIFSRSQSGKIMARILGAFDDFYGPFCGGTLRNRIELHGTEPGQEWQISAVLSMVSRVAQENKWCPEEDSNLHALASAST
jgi:hypothetical protein